MLNNKTVYIIIPCFNCETSINKCLQSVISSTYKNIRIICINDGSNDHTKEILEGYKEIILINQTNKGPAVARNSGLDYISSYEGMVVFIDSDDYIDSDYIEKMVSLHDKYKVDIVCASHYFTGKDNESPKKGMPSTDIVLDKYDAICKIFEDKEITSFSHHKLFDIKVWNDVRYPEDGYFLEDTATIYKTFLKSNQILLSPYCGYHYVQSEFSIMRSKINNYFILTGWKALKSVCDYPFVEFNQTQIAYIKSKVYNLFMDNFLELYPRTIKDNFYNDVVAFYRYVKTNKMIKYYLPQTRNTKIKKLLFLILPRFYRSIVRILIFNKM